MDLLLLRREGGLAPPLRRSYGRPGPFWGGAGSETLVRKMQLEHGLDQAVPGTNLSSTSVNDLSWDCTGSYLASAGDDCALHVYSSSGSLLRSFDPVRAAHGVPRRPAQRAVRLPRPWPRRRHARGPGLAVIATSKPPRPRHARATPRPSWRCSTCPARTARCC
jgi:hypothetical protein